MAKTRVSIPDDVRSNVLHLSDHTCAKCGERGLPIQIHHINEDPADNSEQNLVVLCLACHDMTQVKGGFGRKFEGEVVRRFRDEWLKRVAARRAEADRIAVQRMAGSLPGQPEAVPDGPAPPRAALLPYVMSLPAALATAYQASRQVGDQCSSAERRQAIYDVIAVVEQMLLHLGSWCGPNHFGDRAAREFFSEHVSGLFLWRRGLAEAQYAGTITSDITVAAVLADVEENVAELVEALISETHPDPWRQWQERWAAAKVHPSGGS